MAEEIVTLYIDDASLRLMITQGKRVKRWAESPLEPGLVENTVVINEAEVAAKIKQLFNIQKVKPKKVSAGISGLRCLTRPITLPQLPKVMLDEAVNREAKRVLPVPLEQLYISWQTIPAPAGKTQVFLSGIPRKTADALLKTLHQAGLKPNFMDLKPLLLARVVKEATAILVDVQATEFDIVIMTNGIPQPIRSISFASEALSWQEKLTTIKNEVDRTIAFYNSNNPENPLASSVPILASGDLANEPELCQALSGEVGHPVLPLPSPLDCPAGFAPSRYMVNIGLALQKLSPGKEAGASVVSLNALPAPYQPKPISLTNVLALPGAVIAIGLLALMWLLTQSTSADITSVRSQLDTQNQLLQQKQSQKQALSDNITELEKKIAEIETSRNNFTAAVGSLETQSTETNSNLEATVDSLPDTVNLTGISYVSSNLTIIGRAPSEKEVVSYLRNLAASGGFGEITSADMIRIESGEMDFALLATFVEVDSGAGVVDIAVSSLPTTITLNSASYANGTLTMNGRAPDEYEILSYLRDLEASGKFREITITKRTTTEEGEMDFSLILKIGE